MTKKQIYIVNINLSSIKDWSRMGYKFSVVQQKDFVMQRWKSGKKNLEVFKKSSWQFPHIEWYSNKKNLINRFLFLF